MKSKYPKSKLLLLLLTSVRYTYMWNIIEGNFQYLETYFKSEWSSDYVISELKWYWTSLRDLALSLRTIKKATSFSKLQMPSKKTFKYFMSALVIFQVTLWVRKISHSPSSVLLMSLLPSFDFCIMSAVDVQTADSYNRRLIPTDRAVL